ncbi:MAG: hypothetical protein AB8G15_03140 [Saprospiraceae bacterium]
MLLFKGQRYFFYLFLLSCFACQLVPEKNKENDRLLAQVFNRSLFQSELEGMILPETSPQDSSLIVNSFVERWVRDNVLMHQAERNIPKDLNIDELVRDYRASLILHNYEKTLVEIALDSTISDQALQNYYEENKEQYQLKAPILRCYFIKLNTETAPIEELKTLWRNPVDNLTELIEYANEYADSYMLNDSIWYDKETIYGQLPDQMVRRSNFRVKEKSNAQDDHHSYFLYIIETKKEGNAAPMLYLSSQIRRVILHHRKLKLLKDKREEMYDRELRKNNIKIYTH